MICLNIIPVNFFRLPGYFSIKTAWDGEELGRVPVPHSANWRDTSADVALPDGVHALYFTYHGRSGTSLLSFTLE